MKKNLFCPNLSLPENKALVNQLGLFGFYKEYVKNDFNIPDSTYNNAYEGERSVENYKFVNRELFNTKQQNEVVNSIVYQIQQHRSDGLSNINEINDRVLNDFKETLEYFNDEEFAEDEDVREIAVHLKNTIDNFPKFMERVEAKLREYSVNVDTSVSDENDEGSAYDDSENLFQKINYSDESNWSQSTKDTASAKLKIALSLIPKYVYHSDGIVYDEDGNPETELSFINLPTFEPLDTIWNDLLYTLYNVPIGKKLDYLIESSNPRHRMIAKHIKDNPNLEIRNQFESVFSKQMSKFVTVNFAKADKTGKKTIAVFDTNRVNANSLLIDNWYESFINSNLVRKKLDGSLEVNTKVGATLKERYDSIKDLRSQDRNSYLVEIKKLLNDLGIDISMKALKSDGIRFEGNNYTIDSIFDTKINRLVDSVSGLSKSKVDSDDSLDMNNPYNNENTTLKMLATLENKVNPSFFEASFTSGDNKSKYAFVNNSHSTLQVLKFKDPNAYAEGGYARQLAKTGYASHSYVLNKLITDPSFREVFDLVYLDTLGNAANNQTNKKFTQMSDKEKEITKVGLYQNSGVGRTNTTADIGYFPSLIPSDKSTLPAFKSVKIDVRLGAVEDGVYTFNNEAVNVMLDQFLSEYTRVKNTFDEIGKEGVPQILEYHTGAKLGTKFVVFDMFNDKDTETDKSNLFDENGNLKSLSIQEVRELVRPKINKLMSNLTVDTISYWRELGIYPNKDNYNNFFDKSWLNKKGYAIPVLTDKATEEQKAKLETILKNIANKFAAEYSINQFVMMMNQTQLFSGDPALHGKSVIRDGDVQVGSSIAKTWNNFFKRMAKDIAPGLDGNFDSSHFRMIFLKDFKYTSSSIENYKKRLSAKAAKSYEGINPADAQEYTTLDEHVNVLKAYGRLTQAHLDAVERLKAGGDLEADIDLILQPMKPVYVNTQIEGNINAVYYVKSSSIPLIPALTEGLEIDKLRRFMEDPKNNIQRAAYESAVKIGLQGKLNAPSEDGVTWDYDALDATSAVTLSRDGFRIQQELPYHGDHTTINEGSQGRKLITTGLQDSETLTYNDEKVTGKQAKEIFEALHIEKMNRAFKQAKKDLGFNERTGKFTHLHKLVKFLQDEAISRNYPINDIYAIQIIEENGVQRLKIPLAFTTSSNKFESILNSIITNRVINSELPGFTAVQGASSGFRKFIDVNDDAYKSVSTQITWLDPKDTELKYIREENGKLAAADIIVPNFIKDSNGNQINLENYIKEDGTLDTDKLPEEILTLIALRIPTQGYNSMMKFKVKGFLPRVMGDLAIVPPEIVAQMGSDFDVDKLFIYNYHYDISEDGTVSKVKSSFKGLTDSKDFSSFSKRQLDNAIIQLFEDRLSDPRILDLILEPNGFGLLPEVSDIVKKANKSKSEVHTFSTRAQNNIHTINASGKMGTAVFSLFSTFFKAAQDSYLSISSPISIKNSKGEIINLSSLSEANNIENDKRLNVIMYLQQAAVDNSKEQLLGNLNINDYTMGVAGTMAMLGIDESYIGFFLSQPVIKEYVNDVSVLNDITSSNYVFSASDQVLYDKRQSLLRASVNSKFAISEDKLSELEATVDTIALSAQELRDILENNKSITVPDSIKDIIADPEAFTKLVILSQFNKLSGLAKRIQTLQSAMNTDTKGLGASYSAIEAKSKRLYELYNEIANSENPLIINEANLFKDNVTGKANEILVEARNMFANVYTYGTETYGKVIEAIVSESDLSLSDANLKHIYDNLKSFIMSNPAFVNSEDIDALREELLYSENNIAKRWADYSKTPEGKSNILTKRITPKLKKDRNDYNGLEAINSPASNNSADIDNVSMYFYDMINSTNEVERQLAEDIVKYFLITGGTFNPRSVGKYITYDILEKYDFSRKLRTIEDLMRNSNIFDGFVQQYFQNNPFKAKSLTIKEATGQENGKLGDTIIMNNSNNPARNRNNDTVGYFMVYDSNASEPVLYARTAIDINTSTYSKIDILGNKLIKKYNYNRSESAVAPSVTTNTVLPTVKIESNTNVALPKISDADIIISKYKGITDVVTTLETIAETSTNKHYRNLAKDILQTEGLLHDITMGVDNTIPGSGSYSSQYHNIFININRLIEMADVKGLSRIDLIEETIMHEILHGVTVRVLEASEADPSMISRKQLVAANKIKRLQQEYRKTLDADILSKFESLFYKWKANYNSLTKDEQNYLGAHKALYYPAVNPKEFITVGLTNPTMMAKLKTTNLWTRLLDLIAHITGVKKSDLEFLYEATFELANKKETVKSLNNNTSDNGSQVNKTPKSYTGLIKPEPNTIFVFGSNPEGRHGAGAAKIARTQFGAIYGRGEGLQGNSYALPTKDLRVTENRGLRSISEKQIINNIKKLYQVALENPNKDFKIGYTNKPNEITLNGYSGAEMIQMFIKAGTIPDNIIFSDVWVNSGLFNSTPEDAPFDFEGSRVIDVTPLGEEEEIKSSFFKPANKEQADALENVKTFLKSNDRFYVVEGKAGTGKTSIIQDVILDELAKGTKVAIAALAHKAKDVLKRKIVEGANNRGIAKHIIEDNLMASSVAGLLGLQMDLETGKFTESFDEGFKVPLIRKASFIVIDEASMINEEALELITNSLKKGAKVVFLGDIGQLPPIRDVNTMDDDVNINDPSPVFTKLNVNKSKLLERVRQGEGSSILPYADLYWNNSQSDKPVLNPAPFKDRVNTRELQFMRNVANAINANEALFKAMIDRGNPNLVKIVSYRNATRQALNKYVRNRILFTDKEPAEFEKNEILVFNDNYTTDNDGVIENSTEVIVRGYEEGIDERSGVKVIHLQLFNPTSNTSYGTVNVVASEDKNKYSAYVSKLFNKAKELPKGTNERREALGDAWVAKNRFANLDYAYAITSHKSQGSTYNMTIVFEDDIMGVGPITEVSKSQSMYTAITRSSDKTIIVSDNNPAQTKESKELLTADDILNKVYNSDDYANFDFRSKEIARMKEKLDAAEFVSQKKEFLRAFSKTEGQRISQAQLDRMKNHIKDHSKYTRIYLSLWNGELRVHRRYDDDLNFDIGGFAEAPSSKTEEPKKPKTAKDKVIEDLINRYNSSIRKFEAKLRQLGEEGDVKLETKIIELKEKLRKLEEDNKITTYLSQIEEIIQSLEEEIPNITEFYKAYDALTYINTLKGLNTRLNFTEDNKEYNDRVDMISAKAVRLNTKLKNIVHDLLSESVNTTIAPTVDFTIGPRFNEGLTDISMTDRMFLDGTNSKSQDVQAIQYLINWYQMEANLEHDKFVEQFTPIVSNYVKVNGNDFTRILQKDENGKLTGSLLNKYKDEYYKMFSEADPKKRFRLLKQNTDVYMTDELLEKWEADKKRAFEVLVSSDYLKWLDEYNPETYIKAWNSGKDPKNYKASRYVKITPKEKWIDPEYKALKALPENDPARVFYEFIEPIIRRNNYYHGKTANHIPEIEKGVIDTLLEGNFLQSVGSMKAYFADIFKADVKYDPKDIDIITGEPRLHIPTRMYGNELTVEQKSLDLIRIVEAVAYQEMLLKQKYKSEPLLNMYYAMIKQAGTKVGTDEEGNPIGIEKEATEIVSQTNFMINQFLYEKNRSLSKAEGAVGKSVDALIKYTRVIGMGWNPFSAIGNITQGLTGNYIFADGRYFNKKEYTKATTLMMNVIAGSKTESKKITKLMEFFDVFVKSNELNYGKSRNLEEASQSKLQSIIKPFAMQQAGEYFIQGQTMMGILQHQKVKKSDGKEYPLYEAFDENGKWKPEFGEYPYDTSTTEGKQRLFKLRQLINTAITDVHGNYTRPIEAKKDFGWRAVMIFRTWLPQALHTRFGSERTNILTGLTNKGRYRSYGSMIINEDNKIDLGLLKENISWLIGMSKDTKLSEIDKFNMKRNFAELQLILALTLAIMLIKGATDDMDEEELMVFNYLINVTTRSMNDLTFFMNYDSFNTIIQDPIPLMRTTQSIYNVLPAAFEFITGDDTYKSGFRKGDSKLGKKVSDLIPFYGQVDKNVSYAMDTFD